MSTRCQPTPRWGWLLLLGGLTACGNNMPWANPQAAANPVGSTGRGEPGTGAEREMGPIDPALGSIEAEGALDARFVNKGYGSAWAFRTADLDGDGKNEILYGGRSVAAAGADEKLLWTFELPPEEAMQKGGKKAKEDYDQRKAGDAIYAGRSKEDKEGYEGKEGKESKEAEKMRFLGLHVRDMRVYEGSVLVLDSANRVHRLDSATGELVYTQPVEIDGAACEIALLDADQDDVADFFVSGGKTAYSGKTGEPLWEANVDFTPSSVRSGNLDGQRGRELLLIEGDDSYQEGICPAEKNAFLAMHDGMEERAEKQEPKAEPGAVRPGREQEDQQRPEKEGGGYAALDAQGQMLYEARIETDITTALIADLDGDQRSEVILGTEDGLSILDGQGNVAREIAIDGNVDKLLSLDVNEDDANELIVSAYDDEGTTLHAYTLDGEALWNAPLGARAYTIEALDLDGDGMRELITGLGYTDDEPGIAPSIAWRLGTNGPEELWRFGGNVPARAYVALQGEGPQAENRVYIAGGDAVVHALQADTGRVLDTYAAGSMNHDLATGDLDGDGTDEIITGDVFGNLMVTGADGEPFFGKDFEGRLDSEGPAVVTGIQVAEPEGDNPGYFVVSGYAWRGEDAGIIQAYDADGNKLFSATTPNGLAKAKLADLDGDGTHEIVVAQFTFRFGEERDTQGREQERDPQGRGIQGRDTQGRDTQGRDTQGGDTQGRDTQGRQEPMAGKQCGVMAYDIEGNELWNTEVASCDLSQIAVGDIDGDGADEVAYGDFGREGPYHVALLDGEGNVTWDITSDADDTVWLEIIDDGVAFGGRSEQDNGHVTVLDAANGDERWRMDLSGQPAEEVPGMEDSPFGAFAGSLFGQKLDDVNGDGTMDLAFTTAGGDVMVADGKNGEVLFETSLKDAKIEGPQQRGGREPGREETEERMGDRPQNLVGGPISYVTGGDNQPGHLVVTGYDFENLDTHAFVLDVQTGDVIGAARLDQLTAGVAPAMGMEREEGVVIVTTFDTYAFDIGGKPERTPRPSLDGYDGYGSEDVE